MSAAWPGAAGPRAAYQPLVASAGGSSAVSTPGGGQRRPQSPQGDKDIVQFSSPVYYVNEEERSVRISVIRIGSLQGECKIKYDTEDASAKAGDKYERTTGTLTFAPGVQLQSFTVKIIDDDSFDTTIEFRVNLESPRNCSLQHVGQTCRVLIIDDDNFPSNNFQEELASKKAEDLLHARGFVLLWHFMVFTWSHVPDVKKKTIVTLLLAQLGNIYYFSTILLKVYLVDVCLNLKSEDSLDKLWIRWGHSDEDNRKLTAIFLGLCWILPNFILTGSDWFEMRVLEVGFTIRRHLRVSLFRKYLNYTDESRREVPIQDLKTSMMEDIPDIVSNGYVILFELWRSFGKIVCVAIFMLKKHPRSALPLVVYPSLILIFLLSFHRERMKLLKEQGEGESKMQGYLLHASHAYRLIDDYKQQGFVVSRFEEELLRQRQLNTRLRMFNFKTEELIPWITLLAIGFYMAWGGGEVIKGNLKLGSYLQTMNVYKDLGDRFQGIYGCFSSMTECIEPLVGLTIQLNLPTMLPRRLRVHRAREALEQEELQKMPIDPRTSSFDLLPIGFKNVTTHLCPALSHNALSLRVRQGVVVCVSGSHQQGKATVLHLLTDHVLPDGDGTVCCPLHLRFLNVSHTALLVESLSLYSNLAFGQEDSVDVARMRGVLMRLKLDKPWILEELDKGADAHVKLCKAKEKADAIARSTSSFSFTLRSDDPKDRSGEDSDSDEEKGSGGSSDEEEDEEDDQDWQSRLSSSELKRLHLARAFIYNPEVMLLHRPLDGLDSDIASRVLGLMREFVDGRGVEMDASSFSSRRPRTLFFTCGSDVRTRIADEIWRTTEQGVVSEPGQR